MIILLSFAVAYDFRCERIPNAVIVIGLLYGVFYRFAICGEKNPVLVLIDLSVPFLLFFVFFVMGAFGAGDIKLLMMTGVYFGTAKNLWCISLALVVAAMIGLVRLLVHKRFFSIFASLFCYFKEILTGVIHNKAGKRPSYLTKERKRFYTKIHFSLPVLIGAAFVGFFEL